MNAEVLNSWKEIAAYMGRGVRTVQRWEQELGLPVRRPRGKERSAVIALKPDLDRWLQKTPQHSLTTTRVVANPGDTKHVELHDNTQRLLARTHMLVERSTRMREMVTATLAIATQLRDQQAERMRQRRQNAGRTGIVDRRVLEIGSQLSGGVTSKGEA